MKLSTSLIAAAWLLLQFHGPPAEPHKPNNGNYAYAERILCTLATVESGGDPSAYNPSEDAAGIFQIRPIYVRDVNRIVGRAEFTLEDRWDVGRSAAMVAVYFSHYVTPARLGREPTVEDYAKIHNGGPNGFRKAATDAYAAKFMQVWNNED